MGSSLTDHPAGDVIAVVDDDPGIVKSLAYLLESADHTVLAFSSAVELIESGCLAQIDCVISDIDMPLMDGFALAQAVHDARPELPVLLITGHPEMLNRLASMSAGQQLAFRKPFDGEELLRTIGIVTRHSGLRRPRS